jgi:Tol biopolymer transport system component
MNADGSNPVNLTPKAAADAASSWCSRAPSWSRDGRIYFMSFRTTTNGDAEIFSMADDGADLVRLTTSAGEDGGPRAR